MKTEETDSSIKKQRLQAFLASCGIGSRRHCETLIEQGRATINGQVASIGQSVLEGDEVRFDGKIVKPQTHIRYIALNKPVGYVSTMADELGRPTVAGLLKNYVQERVYSVGRLDQWSSGLILFTNDGQLAKILGHPSGNTEKEYEITTDLPVPSLIATEFIEGVWINGVSYKAKSVNIIGEKALRVVLIEGKNRELRRVLEFYGLRALALRRIRIGDVLLGDLPEGAHRELTKSEIEGLKQGRAKTSDCGD
jgi:23S rRNA pseudouridine2605 synthase